MKSMISSVLVALACLTALAPARVLARQSHSAPLAADLAALMFQQKLNAAAAKDPNEPDRFVAAMLFPGVQLLVVSGRYSAPTLLQQDLDKKQYQDIYSALQQSSDPKSRLFFQDMNADGLRAERGEAVDIMYEHVTAQTMFDGEWATHKLTEKAYLEKFAAADAQYSRILSLLIAQLKAGGE